MSNSLWPHKLQHIKLPCPSPSPGVCSNSCPLSWWCRQAISSSVNPFFSCLQSFPASGSFPIELALHIRWPKIGASASVLPLATGGIKSRPGGHRPPLVPSSHTPRLPSFQSPLASRLGPPSPCSGFILSILPKEAAISLPFLWKFHPSQPTDMPIGTPVSLLQKPFSPSALPLKALTSTARPLTRVSTALTHL